MRLNFTHKATGRISSMEFSHLAASIRDLTLNICQNDSLVVALYDYRAVVFTTTVSSNGLETISSQKMAISVTYARVQMMVMLNGGQGEYQFSASLLSGDGCKKGWIIFVRHTPM